MELIDRTDKELKELAAKFELPKVKLPLSKERRKNLISALMTAHIKMKTEAEAKARAELATSAAKKLGIDTKKKLKPSVETKAIEASKKKYYVFHNQEEEGVKIALRKGEKYRFELFDGRIHILPEWLVRNLRTTAVFPLYAQRKNPVTGHEDSVHVGNRPRFSFEELDEEVPEGADFGVVVDNALEKKFLQPVLS